MTIHSSWVLLYLISYLTGSWVEAIGSGCACVVTGITFTLITVRVGLGWGQESRTAATTSIKWAMPSFGTRRRHLERDPETDTHPMQTISLHVTQTAEVEPGAEGSDIGEDAKKAHLRHSEGIFGGHV